MTLERRSQRWAATGDQVQRAVVWLIMATAVLVVAVGVFAVMALAASPLEIRETADVKYMPGGAQVTYHITLTNQGATPLTGVVVSDTVPAKATLLYFITVQGKWLSTQANTPEGLVAMWIDQSPLEPGAAAELNYVVQMPWQDAPPGRIEKPVAVAQADGIPASPAQEQVTALLTAPTPTQPPTPTTAPTVPPTVTSTPPPFNVAVATAAPSETSSVPTETATQTTSPKSQVTSSPTILPTTTAAAPSAGGASLLIYIVVIVIIIAAVLWFVLKKG